jgi:hypothetical protein
MKNIEQKIRKNTSKIFYSEPANGHRERFAEKLSAMQKPKRIAFVSRFGYIAAAVIIATFIVFAPQPAEDENTAWNDIRIIEVQRYYAMLLDDEVETTKTLLQSIDEQSRNEIFKDIKLMQADNGIIPDALTDEEKAAIIVSVYSRKFESLQNLQDNMLAYNNK